MEKSMNIASSEIEKNLMGQRIRSKRIEYNYTMEELGAMVGVQRSAVNKWEHGMVANIKQSTIKALSEIFDVSPVWLMGLTNDSSRTEQVANAIIEKKDSVSEEIFKLCLDMDEDNRKQVRDYCCFLLSKK